LQSTSSPQGYPPGHQYSYPPQPAAYPQPSGYPSPAPSQPQYYQAPTGQIYSTDPATKKNISYLNIAGVLLIIVSLNAFFMASIEFFDPSFISYFWLTCGVMAGFGALFAFLREERIIAVLGAIFGILSIGLFAVGIILGLLSIFFIIKGKDGFNKNLSILKI
jgi:hypothetical protein